MKCLLFLTLFLSNLSFAQEGRVIIINGGHDKNSNNLRYLENVRLMYSGFTSSGIKSDAIDVFYGSGNLEDTNIGGFQGYGSMSTQSGFMQQNGTEAVPEVDIRLTKDYVFSDESKELSGPAKKKDLAKLFNKLSKELKKNEDLTLFVTDHGSQDTAQNTNAMGFGQSAGGPPAESMVNLWGEELTIDEFNSLISVIPESNNVRIITNICFGGGLTKLTSKNVCVMANQVDYKTSMSESIDLDLYAQAFSNAMKLKKDYDHDGKVTYLDAHRYAASLDNKENTAKTSLDYFLEQNKRKIERRKKSGLDIFEPIIACAKDSLEVTDLENTLNEITKIEEYLSPDIKGIPTSRKHFLEGRLQQELSILNNEQLEDKMQILQEKSNSVKASLKTSALNWTKMSDKQKKIFEKKAQLEAQFLKSQKAALMKEIEQVKSLSLEIDFLKYADENQFAEYKNIKKCLEGEYARNK